MRESTPKRLHHEAVDRLSPWMFAISLVFLALIATLIVLWVDVPRVSEDPQRDIGVGPVWGSVVSYTLALLWPIFWVDFVVIRLSCPPEHRRWRDGLMACLIPPLRLGARNPEMNSRIWLPIWGWCEVDDELRIRLRKAFGGPMIIIALMILPVLLIEFSMQAQIHNNVWLQIVLHIGTGLIWFAFAFEFILMYSVAEKKIAYCKENWVDLIIILLPLVSFLRSLRTIRAMRLAKLAKTQQLTRMARVYRLRGLAVKAFRALLLFEVVYRITGVTPQKRLERLELELADKEAEVDDIREQIEALRKVIAEQERAKREDADQEATKQKDTEHSDTEHSDTEQSDTEQSDTEQRGTDRERSEPGEQPQEESA